MTEQRFTLEDHDAPRGQRTPVGVKVSSTGTDYIWVEAEGYGYPDEGAQIAVEFWKGRLRVIVYNRGAHDDPTVIDIEHLRAINLGATIGREQGWDVFDTGGRLQVQADDDHDPRIDDEEAVRLALAAGVQCNRDGAVTTM